MLEKQRKTSYRMVRRLRKNGRRHCVHSARGRNKIQNSQTSLQKNQKKRHPFRFRRKTRAEDSSQDSAAYDFQHAQLLPFRPRVFRALRYVPAHSPKNLLYSDCLDRARSCRNSEDIRRKIRQFCMTDIKKRAIFRALLLFSFNYKLSVTL